MNTRGGIKTVSAFDMMEARVSPLVIKELESIGHVIKTVGQYYVPLGAGQAVMSVPGGAHFGASDPRKDGSAVPEDPDFQRRN
jgi:gamma-glutamyltranspeptidase / glutathione hydrolase